MLGHCGSLALAYSRPAGTLLVSLPTTVVVPAKKTTTAIIIIIIIIIITITIIIIIIIIIIIKRIKWTISKQVAD